MSDPFVVKAQSSIAGSVPMVLIYDNSRTIVWEGEADEAMREKVGEKSYWWAILERDNQINLRTKADIDDFEEYDYPSMNPEEDEDE